MDHIGAQAAIFVIVANVLLQDLMTSYRSFFDPIAPIFIIAANAMLKELNNKLLDILEQGSPPIY